MLSNYFLKTILVVCIIFAGSTASGAETSTYAERLGWPAGTKVVIFHVDDKSQSQSVNEGTIKSLEEGLATSIVIMPTQSAGAEIVAYVKAHPKVDAGLHLNPAQSGTPDQVEADIRAEIDKTIAMGITPTHLSSQGAFHFKNMQYIERFVKVAIEKKIPLLFCGGSMQYFSSEAGQNKQLFLTLAQKLWDNGLPVLDDILAKKVHSSDYEQKKTEMIKVLSELKPGITEIIFHCSTETDDSSASGGFSGDEMGGGPGGMPSGAMGGDPTGVPGGEMGGGPPGSEMGSGPSGNAPGGGAMGGDPSDAPSGAMGGAPPGGSPPGGGMGGMMGQDKDEVLDLQLITDPDIKALIESEKIVLTDWRELMERRASVKK